MPRGGGTLDTHVGHVGPHTLGREKNFCQFSIPFIKLADRLHRASVTGFHSGSQLYWPNSIWCLLHSTALLISLVSSAYSSWRLFFWASSDNAWPCQSNSHLPVYPQTSMFNHKLEYNTYRTILMLPTPYHRSMDPMSQDKQYITHMAITVIIGNPLRYMLIYSF